MDQPLGVGDLQAPGELDGHVEDRLQTGQPIGAQPLLQRATLDILGEYVELIVLCLEEPARREIRVLGQVDPGAKLPEKENPTPSSLQQFREHPFDRESVVTSQIAYQPYLAHPAVTQKPLDFVAVQKDLARFPGRLLIGPVGQRLRRRWRTDFR